MSNQYEELRKEIIKKRDSQSKKKLIKAIRKLVGKYDSTLDFNKMVQEVQVGFMHNKIVAILDVPYAVAVIIKKAIETSKITNYFEIHFKVDNSYPEQSILNRETHKDLNINV